MVERVVGERPSFETMQRKEVNDMGGGGVDTSNLGRTSSPEPILSWTDMNGLWNPKMVVRERYQILRIEWCSI